MNANTNNFALTIRLDSSAPIWLLADLRKWLHTHENRIAGIKIASIEKEAPPTGISKDSRRQVDICIYVVSTYKDAERMDEICKRRTCQSLIIYTQGHTDKHFETCILSPIWLCHISEVKLYLSKLVTAVHLTSQYDFRVIKTKEDFNSYFKLRYDVWSNAGYIPDKMQPQTIPWELNFADHFSIPLGVFDHRDTIVGCARLVRAIGRPAYPQEDIITALLQQNADAILQSNYAGPKRPMHPFDLLEAFNGFRDYYRNLIRNAYRMGEVSRVIVHEDHRHRGIATAMVDCITAIARRRKLDILFLACCRTLAALYERSDFKVVDGIHSDHFGTIPVPSILMEKYL